MLDTRTSVILIGGGGHCRACLEVIEASGGFQVAGIVGLPNTVGQLVSEGHSVTHTDSELPALAKAGHQFLITVGQIESGEKRRALFNKVNALGSVFAVVIALSAHVSRSARIAPGTIVMNGALVNSAATIGLNCIVNTHAIVEHDAEVGDHSHVSTGAIVNGQACIGASCFIGSQAVISHNVRVCPNCVIGAGAVIIRDITEPGVYAGNPARRIH